MNVMNKWNKGNDSLFVYGMLAFLVLFFTIAPFKQALFNGGLLQFENPINYSVLFTALFLCAISIRSIINFKKLDMASQLPNVLVWLLPLTLLISLASAASHYMAINSVFIFMLFAAFFVFGNEVAGYEKGMEALSIVLLGSGYMIVIFGYMNWFGDASMFGLINWSEVPDVVSRVYHEAVQIDSNGPRMASVFQYANAYAGYLGGLLITSLYILSSTQKRWIAIVIGIMITPMFLALLMTLSRGGWATAMVSFLLLLPFIRLHKQLLMLIYAISGSIMAITFFSYVNSTGNQLREAFSWSNYFVAWLLLLAASSVIVILVLVINRFFAPKLTTWFSTASKRMSFAFLVPVALLVLSIGSGILLTQSATISGMLPDNIQVRVTNFNFNQHSVLERGTFYKDAGDMVKDYPLIGAGGGAWFTLYEKYQNNPYTSRQAHNFLMQHLVATGIIGSAILIAFLLFVIIRFLIKHFKTWENGENQRSVLHLFLFLMPILLHSIIDFDMSYVYIGALVFLCLGVISQNNGPLSAARRISDLLKKSSLVLPTLLLVVAFTMLFGSAQFIKANSNYNEAIKQMNVGQTMDDYMKPLQSALDSRPYHPLFAITMSDVLDQLYEATNNEAFYNLNMETINNALKQEMSNTQLLHRKMNLLLDKGKLEDAYLTARNNLDYHPWNVIMYETQADLALQLIEQDRSNKAFVQDTLSTYWEFNKRVEHLKTLPDQQLQGNPFFLTPKLQFLYAKSFYLSNAADEAEQLLIPLLNEQLESADNRQIARLYIASLRIQGRDDPSLFMRLNAFDPEEANYINDLVLSYGQ